MSYGSYSVGHTAAGLPTLHLKVGPPATHANASGSISDSLSVRAGQLGLSNDVIVSAPNESNGRPSGAQDATSILSSLPRTRPQRATARRAAARKATSSTAAPPSLAPPASNGRSAADDPDGVTPRKPKAAVRKASAPSKPTSKPRTRSAPRRAPAPTPDVEPVPPQGFESEHDRARGPVHPPGGVELVASAAEIVGELAKAGLSTGERLLKDLLSHLPLA
jgi:hypothetical protein